MEGNGLLLNGDRKHQKNTSVTHLWRCREEIDRCEDMRRLGLFAHGWLRFVIFSEIRL